VYTVTGTTTVTFPEDLGATGAEVAGVWTEETLMIEVAVETVN
jgi:hypothetical protein